MSGCTHNKSDNANIPYGVRNKAEWYVLHTHYNSERIVHRHLEIEGFETFLPLVRTLRLWKNRQKKLTYKALFPGYIFVFTRHYNLYDLVKIPKVVRYVHNMGIPSAIPADEVSCIRKMLCLDEEICVDNNYSTGEYVQIIRGPLYGHKGILVSHNGKTRFGIRLKDINHTAV